jgi:RTA1 like protein
MIEFALGVDGYLFSNEWCLFVFEAVPMWVAIGLLAWFHPVKWLQETSEIHSSPTELKEQYQAA